jgi:hypothetical protein
MLERAGKFGKVETPHRPQAILRLLVRCALVSQLIRSGEFTASFAPLRVPGNPVIRAVDNLKDHGDRIPRTDKFRSLADRRGRG